MEKNVVISVTGKQKHEGAESEAVEFVTDGVFRREDQIYILTYQESEVTGMEGTQTVITAEGDQVTLLRTGEYNSQMVFQEGVRHLSMYNTPYGALAIGVNTHRLQTRLDDSGGEIVIDYAVEVEHTLIGRNIFEIRIREAEGATLKQ